MSPIEATRPTPDERVAMNQLIDGIRGSNLDVYRASPARLREDIGSEAEIAHDYQGRLIYELLQNADDAMGGHGQGDRDKIRFRLTDAELLVMNSGRTLTDADVRGLTSTGASSKTTVPQDGQRASIGHKGMGFKSILEITDRPEVHSRTYSFVLDGTRARPEVSAVLASLGQPDPHRVPTMRFPWITDVHSPVWEAARSDGFNVLFRFPFKRDLDRDKVTNLTDALLNLPATTILFLKNLEVVEVEVDTSARTERLAWSVTRERETGTGWEPSHGLAESGVYQVRIKSDDDDDDWRFLLGHENGVAIGRHRGGLNDYAWAGVERTEVTVAALVPRRGCESLPVDWRRFHVFLPTAEASPYPLAINGAFATDLSRQEIRILAEGGDYNRFLIDSAAVVLRDRLLPAVERHQSDLGSALRLLQRNTEQVAAMNFDSPASEFHRAVVRAMASAPIIPVSLSTSAAIGDLAVPQTFQHPTIGVELRSLFPGVAEVGGRSLPVKHLCAEPYVEIFADHGAHALTSAETTALLVTAPAENTRLRPHESGKLSVDPVLSILQTLWEVADKPSREQLELAVREASLFPVAKDADGVVERIAVGDTETFYPPKALSGAIPLSGLRFMLQEVCWGSLNASERTDVLSTQFPVWSSMFQVSEFKFPNVMQRSILPSLRIDASSEVRLSLANWETITAVCLLSGTSPNADAPLPFGRLGSQRALVNLSRLPVPCSMDGKEVWVPAYKAYFGEAWIGGASVEALIAAATQAGPGAAPSIPILLPPQPFVASMHRMHQLDGVIVEEPYSLSDGDESDEVNVDEDDELAVETDAIDRWMAFLTWLGVNHVLRPIHFYDAEENTKGWTSTVGLTRPQGWAFQDLGSIWDDYVHQLRSRVGQSVAHKASDQYFYRLHDLEHLERLCTIAAADVSRLVPKALFTHLALSWPRLERFAEVELALLAPGKRPSPRAAPKPDANEIARFGDDLWMFRLRRASFCPTAHGPRRPDMTWWRSSEVKRRFDRRDSTADMFLPVLDDLVTTTPTESQRFCHAVGVRTELTPSVFTLNDAVEFVARLETLYGDGVGDLSQETLRNRINPAYQNLFELLSGGGTGRGGTGGDLHALRESRLLVHDGCGNHRFDKATDVLYAPRSGMREIYGIGANFWTFVLEGRPAASAPLTTLFGARNLDRVLQWESHPDEVSLNEAGVEAFRAGLRDVAPYLLARLRSERAEEDRANLDATRLRRFVEVVEPVRALTASCSLDADELFVGSQRTSFVGRPSSGMEAYVQWGEHAWPPDPSEAEALATAITEVLEVGYFEPLLAILNADEAGRDRLLHLAGASANLSAAREAFRGSVTVAPPPVVDEARLPPPTPGVTVDESMPVTCTGVGARAVARNRLVDPETLFFDGDPIPEAGQRKLLLSGRRLPTGRSAPVAQSHHTGTYGGGTDLDELDQIGMYLASRFEERRLRRAGLTATIFDPAGPLDSDAVFDVSSPAAVGRASGSSRRFKDAMERLRAYGVSEDTPGFDILSLDSRRDDGLGRLIELKSSGVSARTQTMTWNEWKTAGTLALRPRFFLYLVGNLRADIDAAPFVRAICDPFGQLTSTEQNTGAGRRSVQLELLAFNQAEFQKLVTAGS